MLVLVVVMVVFAIGHASTARSRPLAADLAEPRLLGRYMALNALSWQVGFALGPALGGFASTSRRTASGSRRRALRRRRRLALRRRGRPAARARAAAHPADASA